MKTMYKTNRFHLAVRVDSDNAQRRSKRSKNICLATRSDSWRTSLFLPGFAVIRGLSEYTRTAKWNLFVKWRFQIRCG